MAEDEAPNDDRKFSRRSRLPAGCEQLNMCFAREVPRAFFALHGQVSGGTVAHQTISFAVRRPHEAPISEGKYKLALLQVRRHQLTSALFAPVRIAERIAGGVPQQEAPSDRQKQSQFI